jgi:hypothetical protein
VDTWDEHPCRCGSKRCVGFIVEEKQWPKLLKKLQKVEQDAKKGKLKLNGHANGATKPVVSARKCA